MKLRTKFQDEDYEKANGITKSIYKEAMKGE